MIGVFFSLFLFVHPFHVSVTEVIFKQDASVLQITQRIFFDDLEKGIQKAINDDEYQLNIPLDSSAKKYLMEKTKIEVENQRATLLGAEEETDLVWVYFELENVNYGSEINFESRLLLTAFDDQENLVHFKFPNGKETERLNSDRTSAKITIP